MKELQSVKQRFGIIGNHEGLNRAIDIAVQVAPTDLSVLITGESGTGKEVFPQVIHTFSLRKHGSYIAVNCGAIPEGTIDSELFGHEKGAFTGATDSRKGYFEVADGGTIFLDEVAELPLSTQVRLLRVLESGEFIRVGSSKVQKTDVRVITATNIDIVQAVSSGRFREDLFYRLNVASIRIPPLRNRKEDVSELSNAFLAEFCRRFTRPVPRLSPEALQFLEQLPWRGNVRELRNAMERVVLLNDVQVLTPEHFGFLRTGEGQPVLPGMHDGRSFVLEIPPKGIAMSEVVRDLILKTLDIVGGNQVQAAKVLGLTRSKLRYRMEQLGIQPEQRTYRTNV